MFSSLRYNIKEGSPVSDLFVNWIFRRVPYKTALLCAAIQDGSPKNKTSGIQSFTSIEIRLTGFFQNRLSIDCGSVFCVRK